MQESKTRRNCHLQKHVCHSMHSSCSSPIPEQTVSGGFFSYFHVQHAETDALWPQRSNGRVLSKGYVQYYYIHQWHQLLKIKLRPFNYIFLTLSSDHFSNFSAAQGSSLSMKQPTGIFVWLNVFPWGLKNVCISCCQIMPASQLMQSHGLLLGRGRCSSEPTTLGMR